MPQPKRQRTFEGESFSEQTIRMDGKTFRRCTFTECVLEIGGASFFTLEGNTFASCSWVFVDSASTTLTILAAMGQERSFRDMVEGVVNDVLSGNVKDHQEPDSPLPKLNA